MIIFKVVGRVRNSVMVEYPRTSNKREPLLILRPRSRELLLEYSCKESNGEGCPRGSFSVPREMLSTCNYLIVEDAIRINAPMLLLYHLLKATVQGML